MARVEQMNKRKAAISKMVESIIKGDSVESEEAFHDYLQTISKEIILGESDDDDDDNDDVCDECGKSPCECKDDKKDDKSDDDDDDDDDKKDVKEGLKQPVEGAMKRKVVPQTNRAGKCGIEKHGNSSVHLDDKIKGKAKYQRYPKGKKMKKHDNVKDDYDTKCDGRDKNLGTTD